MLIICICILMAFLFFGGNLKEVSHPDSQVFFIICAVEVVLFIVFSYIFGLYDNSRMHLPEVVYTVMLISVFMTIGTMAACYIIRNGTETFPLNVLLLSMVFYGITLSIWYTIYWKMRKKRHGIKEVLVVGKSGRTLALHIEYSHRDSYHVKYICEENDPDLWSKIREVEIIFLTSKVSGNMRDEIFHYAFEYGTTVYFVPKYSDIGVIYASFLKTDDIPTYRISKLDFTMEERFVKRVFDLVVAGLAIIVFSPVFLIVSLFEKSDGGSVFYTQDRLTKGGRIFKVYKFRSMVPNAEQLSGPVLADENDPRITRLGKLLRATRMDELPQLFNVFKGDMSVVGPRPERPFFADDFSREIPEYHYRLKVKAGLTGLAQIQGKYNTHVTQKLRYDLMYINRYSILRDIIIVLQTVKILFMKSSTEGLTNLQKDKSGHPGSDVVVSIK
ncbi:MAG: sugar transferase [Dysgonamonadaceae bacterium]|nr:sugar transferase [Dysgonamonadaceae bacterium]